MGHMALLMPTFVNEQYSRRHVEQRNTNYVLWITTELPNMFIHIMLSNQQGCQNQNIGRNTVDANHATGQAL